MSPESIPISPPTASTASSSVQQSSRHDHHDSLSFALQPLLQHLDVQIVRTDRYLTPLLATLESIEKAVDTGIASRQPPTDEQQTLLVGISATRTLVRYFEQDLFGKARRPRTGEVAECIETLGEMCDELHLPGTTGQDLRLVAGQIRE